MRALLFTAGSPFARAIRILLDELELPYERREVDTLPETADQAQATPTLQVPVLWDGDNTVWESGLIADYLLSSYSRRPDAAPPLARLGWRPSAEWYDKLTFATIQTFGMSVTMISQMTWTGVTVGSNAHLERSAARLDHIVAWLEERIPATDEGFILGCVSTQDIFLATCIRFLQARPLGVTLDLARCGKIRRLLGRLDQRPSFAANPVHWWEPGVIGQDASSTPVFESQGKR